MFQPQLFFQDEKENRKVFNMDGKRIALTVLHGFSNLILS